MPDEDPRWLIIVEGALGTNTFYNYAANFMEKVISIFQTSSPDNFTPPKKKKSVSKGRKIVSKLKQARSGGRKTTKHNKNSRKYK
jgi:hypothetical protein